MRVVVIGSSGQLGSDLLRNAPSNIEVVGLTHSDIEITDRHSVYKSLEDGADVIINTAAFHNTDLCEEQPEKAFLVNTVGVKNLVDFCLDRDCVLVHISTDYVFSGSKLEQKEPYYEDDYPDPLNIYGLSKLSGEVVIKNYLKRYYIIRTSSLFGLSGASSKGGMNFPLKVIKMAESGKPLHIINDVYMSPTSTDDLARGIWKLVTESLEWGIYHIANSGYCSWYEFARKVLDFTGMKADVQPVSHREFPSKARRPLWSVLGSRKGIKLPPWQDALERFVRSLLIG